MLGFASASNKSFGAAGRGGQWGVLVQGAIHTGIPARTDYTTASGDH